LFSIEDTGDEVIEELHESIGYDDVYDHRWYEWN
jgi:hypothetical protein